VSLLSQGTKIKAGGLLARIRDPSNAVQEFRSPLDGSIGVLSVKEGETVTAGQTVALIAPDRATMGDALRALAFVGTMDDLTLIESFSQGTATNDAKTKEEAALTAKAIVARGANPTVRGGGSN
jgi:multidrug efflux pump subunit AcrA (membrane-fusion protein)